MLDAARHCLALPLIHVSTDITRQRTFIDILPRSVLEVLKKGVNYLAICLVFDHIEPAAA